MIDALKEIFDEVARLPEEDQLYFAELIQQELAAEKRWQTLFHDPRSEQALGKLVAEALTEDEAGETEVIRGKTFLS
ncbi:MAG TPA: hypothetical protein VFA41_14490 [Ktedonobacteraceae bacterium]|jgi:hypothetical protein|nr:hypothetical protein [Ktedonobacteraceae bacterium]